MKTSVYAFGIITSLALIACAAPTETPAPVVNIDNFTTNGKPTKTVETPWGDKKVYDPTQDPDVSKAYEYIYKTSLKNENRNRYKRLFKKIHDIQRADLMRLGCGGATLNGCAGFLVDSKASFACHDNLSMGEENLNACEAENTTELIPGAFIGTCTFGPDDKEYQGDLNYDLVGQKSLSSVRTAEQEKAYFFNAQCNFFVDENDEKIPAK